MKLKTVSLVLFSLILGIGCGQKTQKQPDAKPSGAAVHVKKIPAKPRPKPDTTPAGSRDAFHKNLQIYFVPGEDRAQGRKYVPLAEAMEKGIAQVNETGDVNSLTIENLSETETVFVNAGDIVKGGKQDRYLANSLVVPPKSGKVTLASFCVESGRWSKRGDEGVANFSRSKFMAASVEQKLAAQYLKNQGEVWAQVANSRAMFYLATSGYSAGIPFTLNQAAIDPSTGLPLPTQSSAQTIAGEAARIAPGLLQVNLGGSTSLQLALEDPKIQKLVKEYVDQMDRQLKAQKNPVGLAVAINGKVVSADIYGRPALFKALWPKLINAAATEAMAKFDKKLKVQRLNPADFEAFLKNEKQESPKRQKLNDQTVLLTTKGNRHILFETHDQRGSAGWIHRSFLATPKPKK